MASIPCRFVVNLFLIIPKSHIHITFLFLGFMVLYFEEHVCLVCLVWNLLKLCELVSNRIQDVIGFANRELVWKLVIMINANYFLVYPLRLRIKWVGRVILLWMIDLALNNFPLIKFFTKVIKILLFSARSWNLTFKAA